MTNTSRLAPLVCSMPVSKGSKTRTCSYFLLVHITDISTKDKTTYTSFRDGLMVKALTHVELGLRSFRPLPHAPPILLSTVQFLRVGAGNRDPVPRNSWRVNAFGNLIQAASLISLSLDEWDSGESDHWPTFPKLRTFTARFPDIERLTVQSSREREFRNILPHITLSTTGTEAPGYDGPNSGFSP
ncbi:hypothetical protein FIBSPDRAFT_37014 [Athelia psychrophila]|uniref:Uncharacterized protein n=1 Tax=Athelia psychrophila TaxID=1759441 RepID=A0A166FNE6_9AGAM|nr:hypothetical protein FIBSPDRAFT_37014 [Fibularhizoctonia sp. CBS 109695]